MVGIKTASEPGLTRYLVTETEIFRDDPFVIIDVGSRGGFNAEWRAFGDRAKIYGFEPDEVECARLNAEAAPGITYLPWALGGSSGLATLYESKLSASTGLYRTNMTYFGRLLNRDNGIVAAERQVSLRTLQDALAGIGVAAIDFIKLDVEGAELDILRGSEAYLRSAAPLGLLSEIRFQPEINGSPIFAALDSFLQPLGLRLYGLDFSQQSRVALPYPGVQEYRLPSGERFFAYTTQGQVQDGNALYFRDLLISANRDLMLRMSTRRLLKLAALYEIYSLNDCAAELILACRERIDELVDSDRLLDLLATGIVGRPSSYKDYIESYFGTASESRDAASENPGAVAENAHVSISVEDLQRELAKVYASTSWRITKPLRLLKQSLSKSTRENP
jgi:FkbM family methyltransferase